MDPLNSGVTHASEDTYGAHSVNIGPLNGMADISSGGTHASEVWNGKSQCAPVYAAHGTFPFGNSFGAYSSFGQMLRDADAGWLLRGSYCLDGANVEPCEATEHEVSDHVQGYEASEDSASESQHSDDEGGSDESDGDTDINLQPVDDNIPSRKFVSKPTWIGSDYDEVPCGVDDTMISEEDSDCVEETLTMEQEDGAEHGECLLGGCGCGCAKQELAQEISKHYLKSMEAGYKKRNRITSGPDCRKPRDMGAVEIAMRLARSRKNEHIFEPVLGMVFDSPDEGYEFYNMYSWESGFGIVKNKCRRRQSDQEFKSMQELCCERSGQDRRVRGSTKKIKCRARMKMLRDEDGGWYVSDFVKEHNHPMAETCSEKREWFSHKRLDPYTLGVIKNLRDIDVSQTRVRCIIGQMFGGLKSAPCTKRTIRTICNQIAREQMDGDVAKTMELFKQMKANDPEFQWSVETVKDSRINTLMWCTGKSRQQYACFGDVITFDTTYCTNFYKMPFGLFVGVNNHFQTIVFGGVLMRSETTESFEWVFKEFINLMGGVPPKTVLTDQCKAMTIALGRVWPGSFHLWCKWHVMKNIRQCLGPKYTKDATFRDEFYSIINEMLTKEEFDGAWVDLCARHGLTENPFMIRTFQCRSKWAKPWAKGNFCAGMTSTQRSESANWMLKRFVPRNSSMNHFVSQFNILLDDRDMEEGREENLTKQLFVKYSRLWPVERHAVKVYTRQSFKLFKKQVDLASNFKVSACGPGLYLVDRNREGEYPQWRKRSYRVHVYDEGARYYCECGYFEHVGILCCHTLRVMIKTEVTAIPEIHVLRRWTRRAKEVIPEHMMFDATKNEITGALSIWQRRMNTRALEACTKGNTYRETYDIVMNHLNAAIKEADEFIRVKKEQEEIEQQQTIEEEIVTDVETTNKNRYGASGSSAGLSDSEIQHLRGPEIHRGRGRQRCKRYMSEAEKGSRRSAKRVCARANTVLKVNKPKSRSRTKQNPEEPLENRGLPYQTSFCTKCRQPGHTRNKCVLTASSSKQQKGDQRCRKCGLKGHTETECLVVDDETDGYFR